MSQSKFDVNIKDDEFLTKLCPDPHLFISSMPSDDQLKKQYSKLLKGVIMLKQKISRGKTLSAVRRRGELMDLKIADISAKDVILDIDDAEFLDWCTNNSYARLWHCSQVNKSAILQLAIKNTIQRSPHPDLVNIFDECDDIQLQFVGFVTAPIQHNVVTGLHIHSCALYYTHGGDSKTTIVICAITSRIHILSMMQDCVFQFVQLLQHDVTRGYSLTLTNQFIGTDVILNDSSISGYKSMGFNTKSMTQDVQQGQFTITVDKPIPLMPYSDRFTWAKYGHHILYSGIIPTSASPPPHHPKFTSITHCHFWKQSRHRRHPPTTPNASSPPDYCQHSNSCGNCLRTCEDTSNLVRGPTYTFQNHTTIFLEDQSLMNCHNTTSSHNAPSLTTLSPCPNPPVTTTHRIFSKEGKDTKLGSPMHPKPD